VRTTTWQSHLRVRSGSQRGFRMEDWNLPGTMAPSPVCVCIKRCDSAVDSSRIQTYWCRLCTVLTARSLRERHRGFMLATLIKPDSSTHILWHAARLLASSEPSSHGGLQPRRARFMHRLMKKIIKMNYMHTQRSNSGEQIPIR
jgi:hypothetical protein